MDYSNYGEWKQVPGLEDELQVSSMGWVRQLNVKTNSWFKPVHLAPNPVTKQVVCNHRGKHLKVHQLVALAFIGPQPTSSHTVDHINRDRSDNRIGNLRWASKHLQSRNRNKQRPRRDGRGVLVWKVGSDESSAQYFDSSLADGLLGQWRSEGTWLLQRGRHNAQHWQHFTNHMHTQHSAHNSDSVANPNARTRRAP